MDEVLKKSLDKFGSHFVVASMVPALAFVTIFLFIFTSFLDEISKHLAQQNGIYEIFIITLLLFIPTVIIGFSLSVLNLYIFKFFEGYSFFWRFSHLVKRKRKKANKLIYELEHRISF